MIHSISGKLDAVLETSVAVDVGGVGFRIYTHERVRRGLPPLGERVKFFCHLVVREDALELYGFLVPEELRFFELLISVSGVGPKSALSILEIADTKNLSAAIKEGRPDLLTRASGIGRKTAERIILELKTKVRAESSEATVKTMESDADIVETLVSLGYRRDQAKSALAKVDPKIINLEPRLKAALKNLTSASAL
jgi:holliday junction DNA helicase RuvA